MVGPSSDEMPRENFVKELLCWLEFVSIFSLLLPEVGCEDRSVDLHPQLIREIDYLIKPYLAILLKRGMWPLNERLSVSLNDSIVSDEDGIVQLHVGETTQATLFRID